MRKHNRVELTVRAAFIFVLLGSLMGSPQKSLAAVLMDVSSAGADFVSDGYTAGWVFQVGSEPLSVSALGFWDKDADGLSTAHDVGIWNSDGTVLLGSVVVKSGTASSIVGGFRYEALGTPITLQAETTYVLGALTSSGDVLQYNGTYNFNSSITYQGDAYTSAAGGTLAFPDNSLFVDGWFGPNASISAVPEPSTWLAAGFVGLLVVGRCGRTLFARFTSRG